MKAYQAKTAGLTLLLLLATQLLGGCGWQLRGSHMALNGIEAIEVNARDSYRAVALDLEKQLVPLVAVNRKDSPHRIDIESYTANSRVATVSATIRSAEEQLNMALTFSFKHGEEYLIRSQTLRLERIYRNVESDILASKNERQLVISEMRQTLVEQLVRQILALPAEA